MDYIRVEVQKALAAKRFDVSALERDYESRINSIDRAGPVYERMHAILKRRRG